jgi:hypothetical protein
MISTYSTGIGGTNIPISSTVGLASRLILANGI